MAESALDASRAQATHSRNAVATGLLWGAGFLLVSGFISGTIPNPVFFRIIPPTAFDHAYMVASAVLVGAFMGQRKLLASRMRGCDVTASTGGIVAYLGFACPLCNHVLVALLGTQSILAWVEPYMPWIAGVGVAVLLWANAWMWKQRSKVASNP